MEKKDKEIKLGIKYCPGTKPVLPEYEYVEYKGRPSTRKFTIYRYSTTITQPGGEEEYKTGREDGTGQEERRRDRHWQCGQLPEDRGVEPHI